MSNPLNYISFFSQLGMFFSAVALSFAILLSIICIERTEQVKLIEPTLIRTNNTYTIIIYPDNIKGYDMIVSEEAKVYNAVEVWVKVNANYNHFGRRLENSYKIETLTIADEPK